MNMDGTKPVIDPLALVELEPAGEVEIAKGPKDLTQEELKEYARRTGVEVIKLDKVAKRSIMGELVQRLGAHKVGSSMLIESEEMIQAGIRLCDEMLQEYAHDSKVVGSILKSRVALVDLWVKAAQTHIKSRKDAGPENSEQKPQNTPFPLPAPVQTNIQVNLVSKEGKAQ